MVPLENGSYLFQIVTPKGEEFIKPFMEMLGEYKPDKFKPSVVPEVPAKRFDDKNIKNWLDNNFEHPYWKGIGELCLGCAQCAYVCPTCHCFDIVDESYGFDEGRRVKNWDCCQFGIFTKHASGHNPRNGQAQRFRQRISHKFKYYPDKFNEILCTGCGRCSRGCGVGIDICELVENIEKL
jgi:ferredoxin